jgi:hypothetical protein
MNNSTRKNLDGLLHATADILVRNTEIISVAASGPNIVVMQGQLEDTMGERDSVNEEQPADPAIMNPRHEDQYEFPNGCQCTLVSGGKSHLPKEELSGDKLCEHFLNEIK